jgi:hypothetical protein
MWDLATARHILTALMPPGARLVITTNSKQPQDLILSVAGQKLRAHLIKHANLAAVHAAVSQMPKPQILLLSQATPAIRQFLTRNSIGWVDQTGSAQIAQGSLLISRDSAKVLRPDRSARWTRSMLGVAEAMLTGTPGTVSAVSAATALAASSAATALALLSRMHLLTADAVRGRNARRRIINRSEFLSAYADATTTRPNLFELRVGVLWQDPTKALADVGETWTKNGITWAATSSIAAAILAPFSTQISPLEIYLDASSPATMVAALARAGLEPLEGGRLVVAPFPSESTRRLVNVNSPVPVVPWPRVYADLQHAGVRGEDTAEHLRQVMERDFV